MTGGRRVPDRCRLSTARRRRHVGAEDDYLRLITLHDARTGRLLASSTAKRHPFLRPAVRWETDAAFLVPVHLPPGHDHGVLLRLRLHGDYERASDIGGTSARYWPVWTPTGPASDPFHS